MNKIGIIGHFGGNQNFTDGQTVKTKEINFQIEKHYEFETMKFDTYKNSHNPFKLFLGIKKLLKNNDVIVLIVSQRGYKIISLILFVLNKIYKKRLFDFVIGGSRYKIYDKNVLRIKVANSFEKIYVETNSMKEEYLKRKVRNVEVLPNFKKLEIKNSEKKIEKKLKLCTFTRIIKEKGIEDAIEAVKIVNESYEYGSVELVIYGKPDNEYEKNFFDILDKSPLYIKYGGLIQPSLSTDEISKYDAMLFLTYWKGEGFPGTVLDSFFSGVPIIATDWNCNSELIKDKETGFIVNINSPDEVSRIIIKCLQNRQILKKMRERCINEALKYTPEEIMNQFYKQID